VLDKWTASLDDKKDIDVIYMDFQKAFDKVPHQRLLQKLKGYGFGDCLIKWVNGFLSQRKHRVIVNGTASKWAEVTSGIPQGSVLGPVLFVIYINDLPKEVESEVYLFADDTKIFSEITNEGDSGKLQDDLDALYAWSNKWLLKFHPHKCKVLNLGRKNRETYNYTLDNTILEHVEGEKDLGITIDNNLKFTDHINNKVKKANQIMGIIRRS